jgi:hypothetical protein
MPKKKITTPLMAMARRVCDMLEEDCAPNYETHLWDIINAITYQGVEDWPVRARQFYLMCLGEYADGMQILQYTTNSETVQLFDDFYEIIKGWGDEIDEEDEG